MKNRVVVLSTGVLCLTVLSFTSVKESRSIELNKDELAVNSCMVSQESIDFLLDEELMIRGVGEWSDTKSMNQSATKNSAESLVSKKTQGTDCQCKDKDKDIDDAPDTPAPDDTAYMLIQKYNI